jgi:FtsH-binding integral membrane protein
MATTVSTIRSKPAVDVLPRRRFDRVFFSGTALLMLAAVIVGFGPTYYFAGGLRASLPSLAIHIHGAIFSCWMLLLIVQTALVSGRRVDIHRKLGLAGFMLACAMAVVGPWAATDRLVRGAARPGQDPYFFYIIPLTDILNFSVLILFAYLFRRDPATHKRLIYIATVSLLIAPLARWHWTYTLHQPAHAAYVTYSLLAMLAVYDLWSTHRLQRATVWASAFLIFIQQIRLVVGATAPWHHFAAWVQSVAR